MLAAIQLYHLLSFYADEINNVGTHGMLSAEFTARQGSIAEIMPKRRFCIGQSMSQLTCESSFLSFAHPALLFGL